MTLTSCESAAIFQENHITMPVDGSKLSRHFIDDEADDDDDDADDDDDDDDGSLKELMNFMMLTTLMTTRWRR
eukprot:829592-Amphidinium_carterae.1